MTKIILQNQCTYNLGYLPLNAHVYVLALESFYHNVDTCTYTFHDPLADGDGTWSSYLYLCHKQDICNLCTFYVVEIHDTYIEKTIIKMLTDWIL